MEINTHQTPLASMDPDTRLQQSHDGEQRAQSFESSLASFAANAQCAVRAEAHPGLLLLPVNVL